jgi:hypothetical protein
VTPLDIPAHDDTMCTRAEYIAMQFPHRNDNIFTRTILWNCIGYERKFRRRQAMRYPPNRRFV